MTAYSGARRKDDQPGEDGGKNWSYKSCSYKPRKASDCQQPSEARREEREDFHIEPWNLRGPVDTLISDFLSPELWGNKYLVLSYLVCVSVGGPSHCPNSLLFVSLACSISLISPLHLISNSRNNEPHRQSPHDRNWNCPLQAITISLEPVRCHKARLQIIINQVSLTRTVWLLTLLPLPPVCPWYDLGAIVSNSKADLRRSFALCPSSCSHTKISSFPVQPPLTSQLIENMSEWPNPVNGDPQSQACPVQASSDSTWLLQPSETNAIALKCCLSRVLRFFLCPRKCCALMQYLALLTLVLVLSSHYLLPRPTEWHAEENCPRLLLV